MTHSALARNVDTSTGSAPRKYPERGGSIGLGNHPDSNSIADSTGREDSKVVFEGEV